MGGFSKKSYFQPAKTAQIEFFAKRKQNRPGDYGLFL